MEDLEKDYLNNIIMDWLDSIEKNAKGYTVRQIKNMPKGTLAECIGDWSYHDGAVREQPDLVNVDLYHMTEDGYLRWAAKSLRQSEAYYLRQQCKDGDVTEAHQHKYVEIAYVVKGTLKQSIVGQDEIFQEGEICVIGQNSTHMDYLTYHEATVVFLGVANEMFENKDSLGQRYSKAQDFFRQLVIKRKKDLKFIKFTPKQDSNQDFERVLASIIKENAAMQTGYEHIVAGLLERLNDILFSQYQISLSKKEQSQVRKLLFDDVVDYIEENYANVSLDDLCRQFSYNTYYFNRLIKENTNLTYSDYLCKVRLEKAAYFLKTTNDSVEKIALKVGYTNQGFFYQKFEEKFGMSPKLYRKQ